MSAERFKECQELGIKHRDHIYQEIEKVKAMIHKLEGFTDEQERLIEEIKDEQGNAVRVSHGGNPAKGSGFELMPNLFNGIKAKLSQSTLQQELDQMLHDPNGNIDAKLMRMDALYDDKFTKMQRLIDTKLDKRDFNYFEGVFGKETSKFNGFIESEKHEKLEFNDKINNMEEHVSV